MRKKQILVFDIRPKTNFMILGEKKTSGNPGTSFSRTPGLCKLTVHKQLEGYD